MTESARRESMGRRIGVLGGTFDPIHIGHLRPAIEAQQVLALDEVRLVPCHLTPHRPQPMRTSAYRAELARLAISDLPGFSVDTREMQHERPSFTIDTVSSIRAENPDAQLYFMLGIDSLNGLDRWHQWRRILSVCHLALLRRPGFMLNAFATELLAASGTTLEASRDETAGCIVSVDTTELRVSSTDLRALLSSGGDPRFLVPETVRSALLNRNDYQDCHD